MRGVKKIPLDNPGFPLYLKKWLQHGSKDDINLFADADLSSPEDLHQHITRATNILGSL